MDAPVVETGHGAKLRAALVRGVGFDHLGAMVRQAVLEVDAGDGRRQLAQVAGRGADQLTDTGSGRWTRIEDSWVVEQRVGWCAMRRGGEPWRGLLIICGSRISKRGSGRPRIRPRRGTFR